MSAQQSLMDELEEAVSSGSRDKRVDTLRRITDLFLASPAQLNSEQIGVFDDVLTHLIARVETKAGADSPCALLRLIRLPVRSSESWHSTMRARRRTELTKSKRLSTDDLVDIAQQKGQGHLLASRGGARSINV